MTVVVVIQKTISRFYSNILCEIRAEPEYFRVGFYGGFPPFLKNKVFIFRGHEYEKLSDFNARMSTQFPNAKVELVIRGGGEGLQCLRDKLLFHNFGLFSL